MNTQTTPKPSKLKYQLKVLVRPWLWHRTYSTNKHYDLWLWESLVKPNPIKPLVRKHSGLSRFAVLINGKEVWKSNVPHANGCWFANDTLKARSCSRATALLLQEKLEDMMFGGEIW